MLSFQRSRMVFRLSRAQCFELLNRRHAFTCGWDVDSVSLLSRPVSTTAALPTRALITIRAAACRLLAFLQRHRRYAEQVGPRILHALNSCASDIYSLFHASPFPSPVKRRDCRSSYMFA